MSLSEGLNKVTSACRKESWCVLQVGHAGACSSTFWVQPHSDVSYLSPEDRKLFPENNWDEE